MQGVEGGRTKTFLEFFKEMGELQTYTWTNSTGGSRRRLWNRCRDTLSTVSQHTHTPPSRAGFRKAMKKYDKKMGLRDTGEELSAQANRPPPPRPTLAWGTSLTTPALLF